MIKIRILTLEIKDKEVKMVIIEKYFGKFKIKYMKNIKFEQIGENNTILDIEKLSKVIKNEITSLKLPCRKVSYAVQNETIINRNVKIINTSYKEDIKGLIHYELNQYMPINIKDYILKYKLLEVKEDFINAQAILMPNSIIKNYKELSKSLKLRPLNLSVNFDILHGLIANGEVEIDKNSNIILDISENNTHVNIIKNRFVVSSHTLKNENVSSFLDNNLKEEYKKIYYYGKENHDFINSLNEEFKMKNLSLKNISCINANDFINNIGLG